MKRIMVTRKKFYDIRRTNKLSYYSLNGLSSLYNIDVSTVFRILKARNFREYKASGNVYGKGVKSLRKRYLFLLIVVLIVLVIINQLIK